MGEIQLSVQELSAMPEDSYQLVDIRDERARSYGVIPGSVALSAEELSESFHQMLLISFVHHFLLIDMLLLILLLLKHL